MMPEPQPAIIAPGNRAAIFLVVAIRSEQQHVDRVRHVCGTVDALVRAVGARDPEGSLSCIVAFGAAVWVRLFGTERPRELHPFRELRSGTRFAPATPGDILFHIRAERMDLCFELAAQIMARLAGSVTPVDEVHGFRYFDDRDLTGFVDGTENPTGAARVAAAIVGEEDPPFAGGSYVMVQKYVHNLPKWHTLSTEAQEGIIGRTKLDDIELDAAVKPSSAHTALTTLEQNGEPVQILRHNMPFGHVSAGDAGTYFIGYARSPRPLEQMLENMVVGRPPGNYDRLLDFSRAVTGTLFFVPSVTFLESVGAPAAPPQEEAPSEPQPVVSNGSLGIGSLKESHKE
jgi:putative iron-dependent peroxidase